MKANITKIYYILLTDAPGGAENVILMMAKNREGKLIFARSNPISLNIPENLETKYLSRNSILLGLIKLIPILGKLKKDEIVMSTHPYLNAILGITKRIGYLKTQLIVRECTSVFSRFSGIKKLIYLLIYRLGYPAADLVVCQTELMKEQFLEHNSFIDQRRVLVQPNPVDLKRLKTLSQQSLSDNEKQTEFICTAGRLIPEKGFDILIQAFKIVREENPNLELLILGEGPERNKLNALIENNNLQNAVILKGHISNPAPYFKNAKICVVSSIKEGFPNVLLEMMSLNNAVISTLCAGGISSIPNITKVEVNNIKALANAIKNELLIIHKSDFNSNLDYLEKRSPAIFTTSILNALIPQR